MSRTYYLSGPMSGIAEWNFPAFEKAARSLRDRGLMVVSPAELTPDTSVTWHEALRRDLKALCDCTDLVLLPGWEHSNGAHLELHIAHRLGLGIHIYHDLLRSI